MGEMKREGFEEGQFSDAFSDPEEKLTPEELKSAGERLRKKREEKRGRKLEDGSYEIDPEASLEDWEKEHGKTKE
ncbi:MAG: hypothetical protein Q8Q20_05025 [bacterium]|nr:hypothetical protein [bacterium]